MVEGPTGADSEDNEDEPSVLGAPATEVVARASRRERRLTRGAGPSGPSGPRRRTTRGNPDLPFRLSSGQRALGVVALILLVGLGAVFVGSLKKTPRNMIGVSYSGGPLEGAHFQGIVTPGVSLFFNGWFSPLYLYPADQQNYIVSLNPRVGAVRGVDSIIAPTADRVLLTYQVAIYFKLNTDLLRQFHEQLGLQYRAYTKAGWNNLLQDTFRQQVESAVQQATRQYNVADLYGNAKLLVQLQNNVQDRLAQQLIGALGQPYFCGPTFQPGRRCDPPTFIVKQIDIPSSVVTAFQTVRTSAIQIQALVYQIAQRKAEAQGIQALNSALSVAGENYVLLKAIESGNLTFWVLPGSTSGTSTLTRGR
jgi:SPFH domain / Band 7 family